MANATVAYLLISGDKLNMSVRNFETGTTISAATSPYDGLEEIRMLSVNEC